MPAIAGQGGGYIVPNAGLFDGSSGYLSYTPGTATDDNVWTYSFHVKRAKLGAAQDLLSASNAASDAGRLTIRFNANDKLQISGFSTVWRVSSAVFRDTTAHMHVVVAVNTDEATAGDRIKVYVNNVQLTDWDTENNPTSGSTMGVNLATAHNIGREVWGGGNFLDAVFSEVAFVDGQTLTPSSFGETDLYGNWLPSNLSGLTFGTNGFWIKDPSTGLDSSGNGNDFTVNGTITQVSDTPTDSVSQGVGNFATLNPLMTGGPGTMTFSNGNNTFAKSASSVSSTWSTLAFDAADHFYAEVYIDAAGATTSSPQAGIYRLSAGMPDQSSTQNPGRSTGYYGYAKNGLFYDEGSGGAYGATYTTGDTIGIEVNTGSLTFYKNGVSQGEAKAGLSGDLFFHVSCEGSTVTANFGAAAFTHTVPSGAVSLATQNLPESTAVLSDHFATVLYTGNGSTQSITGVGFQPDFVWVKDRDSAFDHHIVDAVRGTGVRVKTNSTAAEQSDADSITSLDSDGFSLGADAAFNTNTDNYVAWCANLPTDASGSTAGSGTLKTYSSKYNATLGFEVVEWTGNLTADHRVPLQGSNPFMLTIKALDRVQSWIVGHEDLDASIPWNKYLVLDGTAAVADNTYFNDTTPTTYISLGATNATNANDEQFVAYVFYETDLCKKVAYTGNANADGPVVYLDGQPEFFISKNIDAAADWNLFDNVRDADNPATLKLRPNLSNGDSSGTWLDWLATGFKLRNAGSSVNTAHTFIGVAFVNPLNPKGRGQARGLPHV
jgi:hypothetical protein